MLGPITIEEWTLRPRPSGAGLSDHWDESGWRIKGVFTFPAPAYTEETQSGFPDYLPFAGST
jgi:hypothetical protein